MDKRNILTEAIDNMVRKVLNERINEQSRFDMLIENVINEKFDLLVEKHTSKPERRKKKSYDTDMRSKRRIVLQWLKNPAVNMAEIRRMLEGEPESQSDEDTGRSLFVKKVNQTHGKRFSDEEINALYALKSSLGQ